MILFISLKKKLLIKPVIAVDFAAIFFLNDPFQNIQNLFLKLTIIILYPMKTF